MFSAHYYARCYRSDDVSANDSPKCSQSIALVARARTILARASLVRVYILLRVAAVLALIVSTPESNAQVFQSKAYYMNVQARRRFDCGPFPPGDTKLLSQWTVTRRIPFL